LTKAEVETFDQLKAGIMAVRTNEDVRAEVERVSSLAAYSRAAEPQPPRGVTEDSGSQPEMLTPDEAAQLLRVNRKTIYAAIRDKKLPGVLRIGPRAVRIRRSVLLGSVLGQPVGSLNRSGV
jgi:excisionase family DNA binding protein